MTDAKHRIWYFLRNRRLNGYKVVRFWDNEVFLNAQGVLEPILRSLEKMPPENTLIRRCAPLSPHGEKGKSTS